MLEQLKNLNLERLDLEEAVSLVHFAKGLRAEFESQTLDVPEWLDDSIRSLTREIRDRQADSRARRIKEIKARLATLKTTEERRSELSEELKKLEAAGV